MNLGKNATGKALGFLIVLAACFGLGYLYNGDIRLGDPLLIVLHASLFGVAVVGGAIANGPLATLLIAVLMFGAEATGLAVWIVRLLERDPGNNLWWLAVLLYGWLGAATVVTGAYTGYLARRLLGRWLFIELSGKKKANGDDAGIKH